ncbi:hypothetical protein FHS89_001884 [Rubricella aquisinus]|uniref:YdhG-like domain-containing protein n=1 Tax=Rubricella aquisinus TaxID=2028108 RepID=A0A840WZI4_9RHOB|nr:DUF1801 domain-containing protein [Rubricella aquisinus]MBB5515864.1 hypothetical protein [Rubricella aquisinus]
MTGVAAYIAAQPSETRARLSQLRALIHEVAQGDPRIGPLSESLKWGQPSFAAATGTPLRLEARDGGGIALLTHCQTSVISEMREALGTNVRFEGNRAMLLDASAPVPQDALRLMIHRALTYRL